MSSFTCFSNVKQFKMNQLEELSPSIGIKKAWQHVEDSKMMINLFERSSKQYVNKISFDEKKYVAGLKESRKIVNFIANIKDWKIKDSKKINLKNKKYNKYVIIQISGTYKRNKKKIVEFVEWHIYYQQKYHQIQFIQNSDSIFHVNNTWIKDSFMQIMKENI
jgi:tRNA U34 5-carboxymethylaminomethyl modifying GTPase MnmE/TrmE